MYVAEESPRDIKSLKNTGGGGRGLKGVCCSYLQSKKEKVLLRKFLGTVWTDGNFGKYAMKDEWGENCYFVIKVKLECKKERIVGEG